MNGKPYFATLTVVLLVSATASCADVWGRQGDWDILVDDSADGACYATRNLDDGSSVFMGYEASKSAGFFAVYNPAWTQIQEGEDGLVTFDFGKEKFAGEVVGKIRDGVPGAYAHFNNPAFADAVGRYETVQITGSKGAKFSMALTGTHKAISAVRECQQAQETSPE